MTFWETVERGEYVMIALAVILIVIICIWWARAAVLGKESSSYPSLMQRLRDHITEGDLDNARNLCQASKSAGAKVIDTGVKYIGHPMLQLKSAMADVASIEKDSMGKGSIWLRAFAIISPLLGLGGTLVGIIDRLRDMGEMGGIADASVISAQIAPTIVTTVAGLGVGIFAIIAYTALDSKVENAKNKLDHLAVEFSDLLNEPS